MAVQAQLYPENLASPFPMLGLQPALLSFDADFCFSLQGPTPLDQNAQNLASSSSSTCDNFPTMKLSQSLDALLEVQKQELDFILHLQNERLKSVVREERKRQVATLIKVMETKASYLMRQKEQDLARATKKTVELEACLEEAKMERETWERLAKANEVMVLDLSNALEQVNEGLIRAEDAESLCCGSCDQQGNSKEEDSSKNIACKHCNSWRSCVLFLPCRHLCSCMSCEAFLDSFRVCKSVKEASMKIFLGLTRKQQSKGRKRKRKRKADSCNCHGMFYFRV